MDKECIYCRGGAVIFDSRKSLYETIKSQDPAVEISISELGVLSFTEYDNEKRIVRRISFQEKFCPECGRKF